MRQGGLQLVSAVFARAARWLGRGDSCVLAAVVCVNGSAPREVGASMLVSASRAHGTIGGGRLEHLCSRRARSMLAGKYPSLQLVSLALEADSNQCCGGVAVVALIRLQDHHIPLCRSLADAPDQALVCDGSSFALSTDASPSIPMGASIDSNTLRLRWPVTWTPSVLLFGAGHVGQAVVRALEPLPFALEWFDERQALDIKPELGRHPSPIPEKFQQDALWLIMTHRHDLDLQLCMQAVRSAPRFVGLIGSTSKRRQFAARMTQAGYTPDEIARITCPIGVRRIQGKAPAVIAASVAAQLLGFYEEPRVAAQISEKEAENHPAYWL